MYWDNAFYKHKLYTSVLCNTEQNSSPSNHRCSNTVCFLWGTPRITATVRSWNENSVHSSCVISVCCLTFYHCSDTVGWVTGRTSVPLVPKDSVSEQREKENRDGWFSFLCICLGLAFCVFFWFSLDYFVLVLFVIVVLGWVSPVRRQEIGLGRTSPKWPILCWLWGETFTQSIAWNWPLKRRH